MSWILDLLKEITVFYELKLFWLLCFRFALWILTVFVTNHQKIHWISKFSRISWQMLSLHSIIFRLRPIPGFLFNSFKNCMQFKSTSFKYNNEKDVFLPKIIVFFILCWPTNIQNSKLRFCIKKVQTKISTDIFQIFFILIPTSWDMSILFNLDNIILQLKIKIRTRALGALTGVSCALTWNTLWFQAFKLWRSGKRRFSEIN